jgi:hypothetical protein
MVGGKVVTNCDCCGGGMGGACCSAGSCSVVAGPLSCSGHYLGDGTTCSGVDCGHGACCNGGVCSLVAGQAACNGTYLGDGTTCSGVDCTKGACCNGGNCTIKTSQACNIALGIFMGDGTVCDPNPCAGACCSDGGTCTVTDYASCASAGGHYQGDRTDCGQVDCRSGGIGTSGACCNGTSCSNTTPQGCYDSGGSYRSDGSLCSPNPCTGGTSNGACCTGLIGGVPGCSDGPQASCTGIYQGDGTTCNTVPRGCCAIPTAGTCNYSMFSGTSATCCEYAGGFFLGFDLCGNLNGACRFNGFCFQKTAHECECLNGTFYGVGSVTCT